MSENILLGITGSIASSKSEVLFQLLNKQNNVEIFSTNEGLKYVSQDFKMRIQYIHHGTNSKDHHI